MDIPPLLRKINPFDTDAPVDGGTHKYYITDAIDNGIRNK
jgi:hypothetical protein